MAHRRERDGASTGGAFGRPLTVSISARGLCPMRYKCCRREDDGPRRLSIGLEAERGMFSFVEGIWHMIDTMRSGFPADMARAADSPDLGALENVASDVLDRIKDFAREKPTTFAFYAFGIGFILGWKLKPW
jgi:hypothetical protein